MSHVIQAPSIGCTTRSASTWLSKLAAYMRLRRRRRTHSVERIPAHLRRDIGVDPLHRRLKNLPYC
jgi:hypothetical protein